jgi:hypothetical protein
MGAPSDFACSKRASLGLAKSSAVVAPTLLVVCVGGCCVHAANGHAADAATLCMKLRRRIAYPSRLRVTLTGRNYSRELLIDEMGLCDHFAQQQFERPTCSNGSFSTDSTRLCDVRLSREAVTSVKLV